MKLERIKLANSNFGKRLQKDEMAKIIGGYSYDGSSCFYNWIEGSRTEDHLGTFNASQMVCAARGGC